MFHRTISECSELFNLPKSTSDELTGAFLFTSVSLTGDQHGSNNAPKVRIQFPTEVSITSQS